MLLTLPAKLLTLIFGFLLNDPTFLMLPFVSKFTHKLSSKIANENQMTKKISLNEMAKKGYLSMMILVKNTIVDPNQFIIGDDSINRVCTKAAEEGHLDVLMWGKIKDFTLLHCNYIYDGGQKRSFRNIKMVKGK